MVEVTQQALTDEVITYLGKTGYFHVAAYDTPLLITDSDRYDVFHHFELFERKLLWINPVEMNLFGSKQLMAPRVIFIGDPNTSDSGLISNRLASLLSFLEHGLKMGVLTQAGSGSPVVVLAQPQEMYSAQITSHRDIDALIQSADPSSFSQNKWTALAHYRHGVNTKTPYFGFLSFWKIVELRFEGDDKNIRAFLDKELGQDNGRYLALHDGDAKPATKLYESRDRSAHFALNDRKRIEDPDNPDTYEAIEKDSVVLKQIAETLIEQSNW